MLEIKLKWRQGDSIWIAPNAPPQFMAGFVAWAVGVERVIRDVKSYELAVPLELAIPTPLYQTSAIHGRSCYLGRDDTGNHYFAKGVGWVLADGWKPSFDNLGIFPLWAALRERDVACRLQKLGLSVVEPIAICEHDSIPLAGTHAATYVDAEKVRDLDQTNARPVMYVYRTKDRWRLADLPYLGHDVALSILQGDGDIRDWFKRVISKISSSVAVVHAHAGHDHTLSQHNIFTSGTRVDFEYVAIAGLPHPDKNIDENSSGWRTKELFSLKVLAWELNEFLVTGYTPDEIDRIITLAYSEIHGAPLPY